jgi:hypothetical protein
MSQISSATQAASATQINTVPADPAGKSGVGFTQVKDAVGVAGAAATLQAAAAGDKILAGPVTRTGKDGKVYQLQLENTNRGPAVRVNVSGPGSSSQLYIGQDKFEQYCARYGIADNPFPLGK